ncbi:MAG: diversity-generating retroelement protein Avd, partial [Rubrivivax sp.]|nr:diversity-generating retroelement protein Avd [Rubrivivax sp.]
FLVWLVPQTLKFPKSQRFVLAQRLHGSALTFLELLVRARKVRPNRSILVDADVELEKVRLHLRLSHELGLLSGGQYEHGSRLVVEIGRLLGGWLKQDGDSRRSAVDVQADASA